MTIQLCNADACSSQFPECPKKGSPEAATAQVHFAYTDVAECPSPPPTPLVSTPPPPLEPIIEPPVDPWPVPGINYVACDLDFFTEHGSPVVTSPECEAWRLDVWPDLPYEDWFAQLSASNPNDPALDPSEVERGDWWCFAGYANVYCNPATQSCGDVAVRYVWANIPGSPSTHVNLQDRLKSLKPYCKVPTSPPMSPTPAQPGPSSTAGGNGVIIAAAASCGGVVVLVLILVGAYSMRKKRHRQVCGHTLNQPFNMCVSLKQSHAMCHMVWQVVPQTARNEHSEAQRNTPIVSLSRHCNCLLMGYGASKAREAAKARVAEVARLAKEARALEKPLIKTAEELTADATSPNFYHVKGRHSSVLYVDTSKW